MRGDFRILVTYGGLLGRLVRRLGYRYNHILLVLFADGLPVWTYESNWRGVAGHIFRDADLAEQHAWYRAKEPLTCPEYNLLLGYCKGAEGKLYALHRWLAMGWRILKEVLRGRTWALLIPAETCITFVDAACRSVGRPVSAQGTAGLPDDVMLSAHWVNVGGG